MSDPVISAIGAGLEFFNAPWRNFWNKKAEQRAEERDIRSEQRQEQANIRAEERAVGYQKEAEAREQEYIISAEQRANAEYDRRMAEQRQYDDPASMVSRYRSAGLNPGAIAGNITSQPISATPVTPGSAEAPDAMGVQKSSSTSFGDVGDTANLISTYLANQMLQTQIEGEEADTAKTLEEIVGIKDANRITKVKAEIEEATKSDKIELSHQTLEQAKEIVENLRWTRSNLIKDGLLKDKELEVMDKNIEELDSIIALNESLRILNVAKVGLTEEQKKLVSEEYNTQVEKTRYTQAEATDLYELVTERLNSGYYKNLTQTQMEQIRAELEKVHKILWEKPEDATNWWYAGNLLWNIQNCLTLSAGGSVSSSHGSRVVTKK